MSWHCCLLRLQLAVYRYFPTKWLQRLINGNLNHLLLTEIKSCILLNACLATIHPDICFPYCSYLIGLDIKLTSVLSFSAEACLCACVRHEAPVGNSPPPARRPPPVRSGHVAGQPRYEPPVGRCMRSNVKRHSDLGSASSGLASLIPACPLFPVYCTGGFCDVNEKRPVMFYKGIEQQRLLGSDKVKQEVFGSCLNCRNAADICQ